MSSTISEDQYASGKIALIKVLETWDNEIAMPLSMSRKVFDDWFSEVKSQGWTRKNVYDLVWDILKNHYQEFSVDSMDELKEFDTALTGFCDPSCIERFPGDPENEDALSEYVHSNKWR